jgi:hypothetical protein
MFDTDRQSDEIVADPAFRQFFGRELAMRGRCRMAGQRLVVTDIDQTGNQV